MPRNPPATPDRVAAVLSAADALETITALMRLVGNEATPPPRAADWLAMNATLLIEEIRSALQ